MRRKSERNKSKGSPEKKVEKATRKSTRRRGRRATSSSPERGGEDGEGKSMDSSKSSESSVKESTVATNPTTTTRLKIKEMKSIAEVEKENDDDKEKEDLSTKLITSSGSEPAVDVDVDVAVPVGEKSQEGIVWKVARADASPGEIQKLKLCRQRNPSEASDSSWSRKKSHKSYESGEGDGEEGDSAEELPRSKKAVGGGGGDFARSDRHEDPSSSSNPIGGALELKEEVSLCSQVLPRNTTSSSSENNFFLLSDGGDIKKNLDHPIAEKIETQVSNQAEIIRIDDNDQPTTTTRSIPKHDDDDDVASSEPSFINGDDLTKDDDNKDAEEQQQQQQQIKEEILETDQKDEEKEKEKEKETIAGDETTKELPQQVDDVKEKIKDVVMEAQKKSSSDEEKFNKQESADPVSEGNGKPGEQRKLSRTIRRKHRSKYRESSDSDTPESEDEVEKKVAEEEEAKPVKEDEQEEAEAKAKVEETRAESTEQDNRLDCVKEEAEGEKNSKEDKDRADNFVDEKVAEEEYAPAARKDGYKPPKVNLKRSFSVRLAEADEAAKKDDSEKNGESETTPLQVKDNNGAATDETDVKSLPRKRRWGTTITAEVTPAFTVSTDSLKALVPGAKPLSITEVRLSKDDDDEKARRKEREKRYSVGNDDYGDKKNRDDVAAAATAATVVKNDSSNKKGDIKHDNHIGVKRKISILKETPRVKSPSPPSAKATNVLLIKNLVRPFTLNQIKELLSRTGTIVENGFWIDGIKSKCFVVYSNEDQAFETRQALHGISWPVSNPKRLQVEYSSQEDMDLARELSKDQPVQRKAEPLLGGDNWQQVWARDEKQNAAAKVTTVREWDLGKEDGGNNTQAKEKEREKKDLEKKRRQRSRSPPIEPHLPPPARKFKKKEDEPPPAKLLDDLFKKTKAIPCIYWLPLTNEQIVVKEEMRRQHMAEHARRLEEMKRAERSRVGGGAGGGGGGGGGDPGSRRRRSPRK